jgi:flagellin
MAFIQGGDIMSGVGAIGSISSSYSPYSVISAGGKIQSAGQDAAGLAIAEKTEAQTRSLDQGTDNLKDAKSALNIQDGAMEGIADYLQSIKELAIQASNGTLSDGDRSYIQGQIDQYIQGIDDLAKNTTFNEKNLLDGSTGDLQVAADGNGGTATVSTHDSTSEKLGIAGFDVTSGNFDMSVVDKAMEKLQDGRTTVGAQTNSVDHAINYNTRASLELNGFSMDREEDRSINALQELKTKQALDQYQTMIQKMKQDDEEKKTQAFFAGF